MNIEKILELLPHRQPFVLIDRVLEQVPGANGQRLGGRAKALKNVTYGEPFFAGHFPHRPIMPGVLILEALAQAGAMACYRGPGEAKMEVAIGRLGESRFRRPVVPGDQLILEAEVIKDRRDTVVIKCKASVDGEIVTEVEVLAYLSPRS